MRSDPKEGRVTSSEFEGESKSIELGLSSSNLKQHQFTLHPPTLGIQLTFVSPALPPINLLSSVTSPLVFVLSSRMSEFDEGEFASGGALMYVWLVKKWLNEGEGGDTRLFGGVEFRVESSGGWAIRVRCDLSGSEPRRRVGGRYGGQGRQRMMSLM